MADELSETFGTSNTDELLSLSRMAEAAELYDDMCNFMVKLVNQKSDLSVEERNLLSVAFKNVVGSQRSAMRSLDVTDDATDADLLLRYKRKVQVKFEETCKQVLELLDQNLIPATKDKSDELEVFYLKMSGDYYRYLAEFLDDPDYPLKAEENYQKALEVAKANLPETHPTRLGLALNFSVCYYEILKVPDKACQLAKEAFDGAIQKLDTLGDDSYKDSTLIMQLLRDNLTLWTSEDAGDDAGGN